MNALRLRQQLFCEHWHGRLPLWQSLYALVWVLAPTVLVVMLALDRSEAGVYWPVYLFMGGVLASCLGALWWAKGLFAQTNTLLEQGYLVTSLLPFGLGCTTLWLLLVQVLPGMQALWQEQQVAERTWHACVPKDWESRPATVVALDGGRRLYLSGTMGRGSAQVLARTLERYPQASVLELDSTGGFVRESDAMVALLEKHPMDTLVRGTCASACADVFVSGKNRFVGESARFGFHRSGWCGMTEADQAWGQTDEATQALYLSRQVDPVFVRQAVGTPYHQLWKPHVFDVKSSGFATAWWVVPSSTLVAPTTGRHAIDNGK